MFKHVSSLILVMLAVTFVPMVWALDTTRPVAVTVSAALPQAGLSQRTGLVSLNFQDADIRNVLKVLAFKSGVNIVATPDVKAIVSIELKDVPWQKALDVILSTYGYGFIQKDNIIRVMTIEKVNKYREESQSMEAQEPLVSKTFALSFAKAEDVMKIINKLISKRGFINFDDRTNSLIIRDEAANLELIAGVIKSIDTITPEVEIETKVIETDLNNTDTLGIDWVMKTSISGAQQPTIFPFNQKSGASTFLPAQTNFTNAGTPPVATSTSSGFSYGTINATSLSATLAALSTHQHTRTLSNPRVVTLDNQKVSFNVGLQYPMPQYSFNSSTLRLCSSRFISIKSMTMMPPISLKRN